MSGAKYTYVMPEDLSAFRVSEETSNKNVLLYRFIDSAIKIPDDAEHGDWTSKMVEFATIQEIMQTYKERRLPTPEELIKRRQELQRELDPYLLKQFKNIRKSVLKNSLYVAKRPDEHGKDSHVYFYGPLKDFHASPDVPRYVQKYSVPSKEVGPDNIEYLHKKYAILRKILGDHIPRAWFVLGEFRHGIPRHKLGKFHTSLRAITIQREVRGKTFAEMTNKERQRPEVQRALKVAVEKYMEARSFLREACLGAGVDSRAFELDLDVGEMSPDTNEVEFNPDSYSSPNAMYDERKKKVEFIDMGWGAWNSDKERVYDHIMSRDDKL